MKDNTAKTKEQLIEELTELRRRIAQLEASETERRRAEEEQRKHCGHLEESVKERAAELTEANAKLRRVMKSLAEERNLLRTVIDNVPDQIYVKDTESRFTMGNLALMRLVGATEPEELIGKTDFDFFSPEVSAQYRNYEKEIMRSGQPVINKEECDIDRSGNRGWVLTTKVPLRDSEGEIIGLVGINRDITERRRMEKELLNIQKLESIGTLAGGIAHDFNNILTVILGNISLAEMYTDPDKISERLAEAQKASMQARDLTQQLLTFSRGGAPIKKMTSVAELLKDLAAFALRGSNVRCEFSIPDDLWPVEVDEGQMNQAISNIVIKADQVMPDGGIIKVRAENETVGAEDALPLHSGAYVKISVEDQGGGIPEADLQRIFDPYFTKDQGGSGLELATSYSIITRHDGYITAESQVGVGTTFHIYLPAYPERVLVEEEPVKEEEKLITGKGRILVMDDMDFIRELATEMLGNLGYKVTTAIDGAEAIELYKKAKESGQPFDAVIMDLTIPGGMGGKVAIQKLIEIDPEVKAIVSSGYSNDPVMAHFEEYGFKGVITKPYRINELGEILQKVIIGPR